MSKSDPSGEVFISAGVLGRSNSVPGDAAFLPTSSKGRAISSLGAHVPRL